VLDASAAIEWLLQTIRGARVEARLFSGPTQLHAPHLLDVEVAQVLRRQVARRIISASRADDALIDLSELPLTRYPHLPFLNRIWKLRDNLSSYDAVYVALAEMLDATLVTCDRKVSLASGHHARIEAI
jgi:predicted nucleic acid-binding protein